MDGKFFKMTPEMSNKLQKLANVMTNGNKSECVRQLIDDRWAQILQTYAPGKRPQSETIAQTFLREQSGWKPADELREDGDMADLAHFDKTLSADGQTDDANGLSPDGLPNGERR